MQGHDDSYLEEQSTLLKLADLLVINTDYTVFDTTKLSAGRYDQAGAAFSSRRAGGHIKRAYLSIFTNQAVTVFFRHLSAQATAVAASWDVVPDSNGAILGTATDVSKLWIASFPFTGDDHQLTVKTGATLPTIFRLSLRFTNDQALNA